MTRTIHDSTTDRLSLGPAFISHKDDQRTKHATRQLLQAPPPSSPPATTSLPPPSISLYISPLPALPQRPLAGLLVAQYAPHSSFLSSQSQFSYHISLYSTHTHDLSHLWPAVIAIDSWSDRLLPSPSLSSSSFAGQKQTSFPPLPRSRSPSCRRRLDSNFSLCSGPWRRRH